MPHCIIEYSSKLELGGHPKRLVEAVHQGALDSQLFEPQDVKTRAIAFEQVKHQPASPNFVHVTVKLLAGRVPAQKRQLSAAVLERLKALGLTQISLTVDIVDIDTDCYAKAVL